MIDINEGLALPNKGLRRDKIILYLFFDAV
jgi:hypothetical protein